MSPASTSPASPGKSGRRHGFTLLEMLIALAVFGLFLAGLMYAERAYHRAVTDEDEALRMQLKQAAVELLRSEIGMVGYRNNGADISVEHGPATDRVSFRYLEDRLTAAPEVRSVTFDAGTDRNGRASLYRQQDSANRQPAVAGLRALRVIGWTDGSGRRSSAPPADPTAIVLELVFDWEDRILFTVGFLNAVTYDVQGQT